MNKRTTPIETLRSSRVFRLPLFSFSYPFSFSFSVSGDLVFAMVMDTS
ncbi:hypothetical protein [Capnocytophaga granulosa]